VSGAPRRSLADLTAELPPQALEVDLRADLHEALLRDARPLVVIDDDPTGVQTVHDTPVLLSWEEAELRAQMAQAENVFFVLTNSRSMPTSQAEQLNEVLGRRLSAVADGPFVVASRSDSTLRGHFPAEVVALQRGLATHVDGYLLVPAFFEGGRYTIDDTHWVAMPDATSREVVPASATSFARDAVFGYRSAYLPDWVEEKSGGRWRAADVRSISLATVRQGRERVSSALQHVEGGVPVVVNCAGYGDLTVFVLGMLEAEARGKRFLYRTAASFVRVRAGQPQRALLTPNEIYAATGASSDAGRGGLVIVGSYQPSSTQQLQLLLAAADVRQRSIEIVVQDVLEGRWSSEPVAEQLDAAVAGGELGVLHTSRALAVGPDNLEVGRRITDALVQTVRRIQTRPRFLIAKGGITSHEIAQHGLGALRATVLGQLQPGVPVWRLESGPGLRHGGIPYVVFPGNVGGPTSLLEAVRALTVTPR
jgi:uncharacterized protein YgbK (DUF1537 family)